MSLLTEQRVLLAKVETTPGTAESLTGTDGVFNVYALDDAIITPSVPSSFRDGQSAFSPLPSIPGARMGTARFATDLVGNGSAGSPQWATTFFQGCGMADTSGSFAFVTGSATAKTLTIASLEDGLVRTLSGCVGTWTINLTAGEAARVEFEFMGIYNADADVALATPTYPTTLPPRWANASGATYNSVSLIAATAQIAAGNVLKVREDANNVTGYKAGIITNRTVTWAIDPETVVVATVNWGTHFLASTQSSLVLVVGTAANNIITITMPKAQQTSYPERGSRDGVMTWLLKGQACRSAAAGDDELTCVFT